jgi:hypothetical protein
VRVCARALAGRCIHSLLLSRVVACPHLSCCVCHAHRPSGSTAAQPLYIYIYTPIQLVAHPSQYLRPDAVNSIRNEVSRSDAHIAGEIRGHR